ncbi:hypothetical protein XELAEV_18042851mg [Xenopus laevis]|uniref:Ig-like domain-containing protein n=1 Tax=Xenopus laevis TaxID=8355 RepID=A0A974C4M1_XENLA|nr:hypothetical protein XELAEV_18042851mg [Xenopus laevis]
MSLLGLLILLLVATENAGAAKAIVIFSPNWATVFTKESVTLTCHVDSSAGGFSWYKDGVQIRSEQKYTIGSAQVSDSGRYQCKSQSSDRSDSVTLTVSNDYLALKVPPYVFEGDNVYVFCAGYAGFHAEKADLKKGNMFIASSPNGSFQIGRVTMATSGSYTCYRTVGYYSPYNYVSSADISVKELVRTPQIKVSPDDQVTEGDHMTITCDTKLSPHRETTELQFAFYRNGHNVQEFSSSNQYGVPSAQLEDSGNYCCEIRDQSGSVKKESDPKNIRIQAQKLSGVSVRLEPAGGQVLAGEKLEILCSVEKGMGLLSYSWCKQSSLSCDTKEAAVLEQRFVVESVSEDYGGEYQCIVTRTATGDSISSANISISVQGMILMQDRSFGNIYVLIGIGVTLTFAVLLAVALLAFKYRHRRSGDSVHKAQYRAGRRQQAEDQQTSNDMTPEPEYDNMVFQDVSHTNNVCSTYFYINQQTASSSSSPVNNNDEGSVIYAAIKSKSTRTAKNQGEPAESLYENFSAK